MREADPWTVPATTAPCASPKTASTPYKRAARLQTPHAHVCVGLGLGVRLSYLFLVYIQLKFLFPIREAACGRVREREKVLPVPNRHADGSLTGCVRLKATRAHKFRPEVVFIMLPMHAACARSRTGNVHVRALTGRGVFSSSDQSLLYL